MAMSQIQQSLKFELLIPVHSRQLPTACMSFNYHRDHFGTTWGLASANLETAHTACVAFGVWPSRCLRHMGPRRAIGLLR
jgi:seryl-tRNA synthetase